MFETKDEPDSLRVNERNVKILLPDFNFLFLLCEHKAIQIH